MTLFSLSFYAIFWHVWSRLLYFIFQNKTTISKINAVEKNHKTIDNDILFTLDIPITNTLNKWGLIKQNKISKQNLHVRRPHGDRPLAVAQHEHCVGRVLAHDVQPAHPRVRLLHDLPDRDVEPAEVARLVGPGQQEVVGQVLQARDVVHLLDAVDLDALVVVDVGPLLLRNGEQVFCVEPVDGVDGLHGVHLAHQGLGVPVKCCHVTLPPANQKIFSVSKTY